MQVDQQHGQRVGRCPLAGQRLLQPLGEERPVGEAGERVVTSLVGELLLQPAQLLERVLEPAVLERGAQVAGHRVEQREVVLVECRDRAEAVRHEHHADRTGLASEGDDHPVGEAAGRREGSQNGLAPVQEQGPRSC